MDAELEERRVPARARVLVDVDEDQLAGVRRADADYAASGD
jgi:hypothetical protein